MLGLKSQISKGRLRSKLISTRFTDNIDTVFAPSRNTVIAFDEMKRDELNGIEKIKWTTGYRFGYDKTIMHFSPWAGTVEYSQKVYLRTELTVSLCCAAVSKADAVAPTGCWLFTYIWCHRQLIKNGHLILWFPISLSVPFFFFFFAFFLFFFLCALSLSVIVVRFVFFINEKFLIFNKIQKIVSSSCIHCPRATIGRLFLCLFFAHSLPGCSLHVRTGAMGSCCSGESYKNNWS